MLTKSIKSCFLAISDFAVILQIFASLSRLRSLSVVNFLFKSLIVSSDCFKTLIYSVIRLLLSSYIFLCLLSSLSLCCRSLTKAFPLWVRGCRIGPTYPPACRKRRLIGGSLFAVGCDPCQWKRGSWLLSQFFVAALRRQYTALASISLSRKVKMAWLNQSAGSAKA